MDSINPDGSRQVLITGANGFVGRCLYAEMSRLGWQIRGTVRSMPPFPEGVGMVAVGKIDGETKWMNLLHDVDVVIHLAARVHVMKEKATDPLAEFLRTNLHGTVNLARQAARAGVKRLVYVSSIGVNGNRTKGNESFSEEDMPHPHNAYAVSKWQAEQALLQVSRETGLEIVILRPPLVYGPTAKGNFPKLLAAIQKGIPLPLAGANNLRSLIYVQNLVSALIACATHPAAAGQTYLVSDGEDISTTQLIEKIARELGRGNRTFNFPKRLLYIAAALMGRKSQMDQLFGSLRMNDSKLRNQLSWSPPYTLDQGLHETITLYQSSKSGP